MPDAWWPPGDLASVSLQPALRSIVGSDAVGAVVDGRVTGIDASEEIAQVTLGAGATLQVAARGLGVGQRLRLQLLARDLILALEEPRGMSVRNHLRGSVRRITPDGGADLVEVQVAGTAAAGAHHYRRHARAALAPGMPLWVLVKAVSVSPLAPAPRGFLKAR